MGGLRFKASHSFLRRLQGESGGQAPALQRIQFRELGRRLKVWTDPLSPGPNQDF